MSDERRPVPVIDPADLIPKEIDDHWCMHPGCDQWGSFGSETPRGTVWYCGKHRPERR